MATVTAKHSKRIGIVALLAIAAAVIGLFASGVLTATAGHLTGSSATYTLDFDFDDGTLINLSQTPADQLQLDDTVTPLGFLWVSSTNGHIIKIDTDDAAVLGRYRTAPDGRGTNPSRTTVDANGNVWAGNRVEHSLSGGARKGSVVRIGLQENGQCEDRHGATLADAPDGIIQTSTGLLDVLPWSNAGGVDDDGGVSTAFDECIINYVRTTDTHIRHVSVDTNNDVWVGGNLEVNATHGSNNIFDLIDGSNPGGGGILTTTANLDCGGYGGLVSVVGGVDILWSANRQPGPISLLRYDTSTTIATCLTSINSYGLGIDTQGDVWNSQWTSNSIIEFNPAGGVNLAAVATGGASNDRGVTVTLVDDHVWVANSAGNNVSRLDQAGVVVGVVPVGVGGITGPTGVSVDNNDKVWVTHFKDRIAYRIDPNDLTDSPAGTVDASTVDLLGNLYNYSDMTGSAVLAAPTNGTWTVIHDSGVAGATWNTISWNGEIPFGGGPHEPSDSSLTVSIASAEVAPDCASAVFGAAVAVSNSADISAFTGQCLEVTVGFTRATTGETPILTDLALTTNDPPDCSQAEPSQDSLWPPNHKMVDITVTGVTDADGDDITITIDGITQDEEVDAKGSGKFSPDGKGVGTATAQVRAERIGDKKTPGDGRVYHIAYTASDGQDSCSGEVSVGVPHDQGQGNTPIDSHLPHFDSTEIIPGTKDK